MSRRATSPRFISDLSYGPCNVLPFPYAFAGCATTLTAVGGIAPSARSALQTLACEHAVTNDEFGDERLALTTDLRRVRIDGDRGRRRPSYVRPPPSIRAGHVHAQRRSRECALEHHCHLRLAPCTCRGRLALVAGGAATAAETQSMAAATPGAEGCGWRRSDTAYGARRRTRTLQALGRSIPPSRSPARQPPITQRSSSTSTSESPRHRVVLQAEITHSAVRVIRRSSGLFRSPRGFDSRAPPCTSVPFAIVCVGASGATAASRWKLAHRVCAPRGAHPATRDP